MRPQRDFVLIDESDAGTTFGREAAGTPRVRQAALPGIRPAGKQDDPMSVEEIVNYLDSYASQLGEARLGYANLRDPRRPQRSWPSSDDRSWRHHHPLRDRDGRPSERGDADGCSWISQLNPDHAERQIPGIFAIRECRRPARPLRTNGARRARLRRRERRRSTPANPSPRNKRAAAGISTG